MLEKFDLTPEERIVWGAFYNLRLKRLEELEVNPFNNDEYSFQVNLKLKGIAEAKIALVRINE